MSQLTQSLIESLFPADRVVSPGLHPTRGNISSRLIALRVQSLRLYHKSEGNASAISKDGTGRCAEDKSEGCGGRQNQEPTNGGRTDRVLEGYRRQGHARLVNPWRAQKAGARREAAPWEAIMNEQQHQDEDAASNEMITKGSVGDRKLGR